jgi:hypothetical protein
VSDTVTTNPRGLRNNNPGNIRAGVGTTWRGQYGQDDKGFCQFVHSEDGLRALAILLHNYYYKDGIRTLEGMICRYAPHTENDTDAYVNMVCSHVGILPSMPFDPNLQAGLLMFAIIKEENGQSLWTVDQLQTVYNESTTTP